MVYLTLDGRLPSDASVDNLHLELGDFYKNVSYSFEVREWLVELEKIAVREPHLRESVGQYLNVIEKLTGTNLEEGYPASSLCTSNSDSLTKSSRATKSFA